MAQHWFPRAASARLQELLNAKKNIVVEELSESIKAWVIAEAQAALQKRVLILLPDSEAEQALWQNLKAFTDVPVIDFPAWETLPNERIAPSPDIIGERYSALDALLAPAPCIVISSWHAALQRVLPHKRLSELSTKIVVGQPLSPKQLIAQLAAMGYQQAEVCADKGEYAVRGGIVDLFPSNVREPLRIEFSGSSVRSLRCYNPVSQCSVQQIHQCIVLAAQELELLEQSGEYETVLDYLGQETLIVFDQMVALEDRYAALVGTMRHSSPLFLSIEEFLNCTEPLQKLFFSTESIDRLTEDSSRKTRSSGYYSARGKPFSAELELFGRTFSTMLWHCPIAAAASYFLPEKQEGEVCTGDELFTSLKRHLGEELVLRYCVGSRAEHDGLLRLAAAHEVVIAPEQCLDAYLSSGMVLPADLLFCHDENETENSLEDAFPRGVVVCYLSVAELLGRYKMRRQTQRIVHHAAAIDRFELTAGDLVVHLHTGIGRYLGIEKINGHGGTEAEFLAIEYAEGGKLYVPMAQAYLVNRYIGAEHSEPPLHKIGGGRWKALRQRTEEAIEGYAEDLLRLYAQRSLLGGFAFPENSVLSQTFVDEFPFEETEDQRTAISAIYKDMETAQPMDRLVCGDVGYGKTEVAMRAAFKAAVDGRKQVAILVPTTVLAMQHYETLCERMANFSVGIGVLSRFTTARQTEKTLQGLSEGSVQIVVGTHRLLGEDVQFNDLGLIIIDEEQRFGVRAKEALKYAKKLAVDCLTLSATPIPRTLHMSLVGIRDLSAINTPPQDRLPIKTILAEPSDDLYLTALLRELARDGQAYIIHNRVETIYERAEYIEKLLPQARIAVVHGQMSSAMIEQTFHAFKAAKIDILLATTIVESGIDIPNANTMLIEQAHMFGMSDLYQLRGRIGRWNRRAFCYFIVPRLHTLPQVARERLTSLTTSSGYGSGMRIAMKDLELRGAGHLLGEEQSGHVARIGFHLYCKLLQRAVRQIKGEIPQALPDTRIELEIEAALPERYVPAVQLRMELHYRFGSAVTIPELEALWEEVLDRFGAPPLSAQWLYHISRVRVAASSRNYLSVRQKGFSVLLEKKNGRGASAVQTKLFHLVQKDPAGTADKLIALL